MSFRIRAGSPEPLGVRLHEDGVNVAVHSAHATAIEFCLFDATGRDEIARVRLAGKTGDVFHAHISDISAGAYYGLRAHGPYAPGNGHRFDSSKLLIDPFALEIDKRFELDPTMFSRVDTAGTLEARDSADAMPKARVCEIPMRANRNIKPKPWAETILYEMHVRGFTKLDMDIPAHLRGTFAALAQPSSLRRLTNLGVTAVEILPAAAWIDERHLKPLGLRNYWG